MFELGFALRLQLNRAVYAVRVGYARLRRTAENYYVPDVAIVPTHLERVSLRQPGSLDAYAEPLPLVLEIWSPSTGHYDTETKIAAYQARGDEEIWRLHPLDRTLRVWRRRLNGGYDETFYQAGQVPVASLPGVVVIDLDRLFAAEAPSLE